MSVTSSTSHLFFVCLFFLFLSLNDDGIQIACFKICVCV